MTDAADTLSDTVETTVTPEPIPPKDITPPEADRVAEVRPEPVPPPAAPKRASALPMVLGGIVAAAIGFGVAQVVPQGWPLADMSALTTEVAAQQATLVALQTRIDELANAPSPLPDPALADRLTALEAALAALPPPVDASALTQRLDAVEGRLSSMTVAPGGTSTIDPAALTALRAEVEALKSGGTGLDAKVADAEARLASIKTEAEALSAATATRAALGQIQAALDSGAPFTAALANLPDVPDALKSQATSGIPSLQTLRGSYPDAARAALDASLRAEAGDGWTDRLNTFLRGQTGARSLTPREGTDPDAVLSRAEAALAAGDLTTALTELDGLPQPGKDAMSAWLAQATQRQQAVAAVQALSTSAGQ